MGKPYSEDLRRNIVHAIESGHTYEEAAELCGVSISSVSRFLTRWRNTGSISPEKFGGYKGYALERYRPRITRWLGARPDITLAELQDRLAKEKVAVSQTSIFRFLRHLGPTFKKKPARGRTRPTRRSREAWIKMQIKLDPRKLVFIDETAASTNMTRRYGRGTRGERLVCKVPHGHWKTSTFVAALRHNGVTAPFLLDGPMNGLTFRAYVEQILAPTLAATSSSWTMSAFTKLPASARRLKRVAPSCSICRRTAPTSTRSNNYSLSSRRYCVARQLAPSGLCGK
jgi:transposase